MAVQTKRSYNAMWSNAGVAEFGNSATNVADGFHGGIGKDALRARYYYGGDDYADITGVRQEAVMPAFRENFHLGMGINAPMLDVATPCSFTPAVIVVTSVPAMYMQDGSKPTVMAQLTKDLLESHAKSVTGLDFGYTLGVDTSANVGMDSQMFGVPGKTTRNQPSPSFTFTELSGNLVYNWAKKWIWDINHPDTNVSMAQVQFPGAYTMSAYAASFMVIQFDPTMRPDRIIDAAQYVNVFPTGTGDIGFERTIGTVKVPERSITFHAIVLHNPYIKSLAMAMAEKLQLHVHNYDVAPPYKQTVDENLSGLGLDGEMVDRVSWHTNPFVDGVRIPNETRNEFEPLTPDPLRETTTNREANVDSVQVSAKYRSKPDALI